MSRTPDPAVAVIRSAVPTAVGYAVTFLAEHYHVVVSHSTAAVISGLLATLLAAAYYSGVAWAEKTFPGLGWLLGHPDPRNPLRAGRRVSDDYRGQHRA